MAFRKIENLPDYINELGEKGMGINQYQKFAEVRARQGKEGEEVITVMKNGLEETRNTVQIDSKTGEAGWIVTNPSGEQYIVPDSKFRARYDVEKAKDGVYPSVFSPIRAIEIDEDISFTAPWGEEMNIAKGGFLVINSPNDIYGIQKDEFYETYMPLDKYLKMKNNKEKVVQKGNEQAIEVNKA